MNDSYSSLFPDNSHAVNTTLEPLINN